ncbi:MAG: hypothetical protein LUE11_13095 [Clostridia bacterium]|nr:hypothetical protein [Clostridia bacterium]
MDTPTIDELIRCPKIVVKADRRKMIEQNRSRRNNIELESEDKRFKYQMFLRQSTEFVEDFSVGLIWKNANEYLNTNKQLILLRCQGPHDGKKPLNADTHHSFHTHQLTQEDIDSRRFSKPTNQGPTNHFSSFDEAITYFCQYCAIIGLTEHIDLNSKQIEGQLSWI